MVRILLGIAVLSLIYTIYALADAALSSGRTIRALRKPWWILIIIFVPVIGPTLWFMYGKPRLKNDRAFRAPDDDDDFLRGLDTPPDDSPDLNSGPRI